MTAVSQAAALGGGDVAGGGGVKLVWSKAVVVNGDVEISDGNGKVMGDELWPDLAESTRPVSKSELYNKTTTLVAPVISQPQQKPAKANAHNHSNTNNNHHVRRPKRGGNAGGASAGYNQPPPPPLPPQFPFVDMTYCNYVPPMFDPSVRGEQPPLKGNGWIPRPMGGNARNNNFGPRPNGYGGRGPRHPAPQQIPPPPPPPPGGYFRPPHMVPASYIPATPTRPYGIPMGHGMAAPIVYFNTLPMEPYMNSPLPPQAASRPVFMNHPLHIRILSQIEYYFSDANLVKDNFLRSNMDEEGWVSIALIASFRRVKDLTTDVEKFLESLKNSSSVEIQGNKLRRRNEWRKWIQQTDFPANPSPSPSPSSSTDNLLIESSIEKLALEEVVAKENNTNLDNAAEDDNQKDVKELAFSSKVLNGDVTSLSNP